MCPMGAGKLCGGAPGSGPGGRRFESCPGTHGTWERCAALGPRVPLTGGLRMEFDIQVWNGARRSAGRLRQPLQPGPNVGDFLQERVVACAAFRDL
jgi:hypothetical protein